MALERVKELNENATDVLDNISAVHGPEVARAVYIVSQQDRAITSVSIMLARATVMCGGNPESCTNILTTLHRNQMDAFMHSLYIAKVELSATAEILKTVAKLFERQREAIGKSFEEAAEG